MVRRVLLFVLVAMGVLIVAPAVALGSTGSGHSGSGAGVLPLAFLGIHFPSVSSIVGGVVKLFFGALLKVLGIPVHGTLAALQWLVAVPDPADRAQWPTIGRLEADMRSIGIGLLPLTFTLTAVRYWLAGLAGQSVTALEAVGRTTAAVAGLVVYSWAFANVVAAVNVITHAMLSLPSVSDGVTHTVGILFAGALSGSGVLLAIIGLVLVFLAVGLFFMKVLVLVIFGVLYVSGGALVVVSGLPELHPLWRAWKLALGAVAIIPVGWCVLFATAGAFTADVTRWGGGVLSGKLIGALAALAIYVIALKWPLMVLGRAKSILTPGGLGAGAPATGVRDVRAARASLQSAALRAGNVTSGVLRGSVGATGRGVIAGARGVGSRVPAVAGAAAGVAAGGGALAAFAAPVSSPLQRAASRVRDRGRAGIKETGDALAAGETLGAAGAAYTGGFTASRAKDQNAQNGAGGRAGANGAGRRERGTATPADGANGKQSAARGEQNAAGGNAAGPKRPLRSGPGEAAGPPGAAAAAGAATGLAAAGARTRAPAAGARAADAQTPPGAAGQHPGRDLPGPPAPEGAGSAKTPSAAPKPRAEAATPTPTRPAQKKPGGRSAAGGTPAQAPGTAPEPRAETAARTPARPARKPGGASPDGVQPTSPGERTPPHRRRTRPTPPDPPPRPPAPAGGDASDSARRGLGREA